MDHPLGGWGIGDSGKSEACEMCESCESEAVPVVHVFTGFIPVPVCCCISFYDL